MFYSILKESGYFQLKEFPNHPISKRYGLMKSNFGFTLFSMLSPALLISSLLSSSVSLLIFVIFFLISIPIYMKYLKNQHYSLKKYLQENTVNYFKNENNLVILYEEMKKDPHFDNNLLDNEIKLLIGSLEDGRFESSILYLLDKWKRKKDEAVIEENKISRYQQFLKKISGKEDAKKIVLSTYEDYL